MLANIFREWMNITDAGRNEVVFESRNKDYGAYYLRSNHSKIIYSAFIFTAGTFIIGIFIPFVTYLFRSHILNMDYKTEVNLHLVVPPMEIHPPSPPPPPPPPPKPPVNQRKFTTPVISLHIIDTVPPPTSMQLEHSNPGNSNTKGIDTPNVVVNSPIVPHETDEDKPIPIVEVMPKPGYDISSYLIDHIQIPQQAIDERQEGTIYVSFVIERNGSITSVQLLRGINPLIDNEALEVVSSMPAWTPGYQNGHAVRVSYRIPIKIEFHN